MTTDMFFEKFDLFGDAPDAIEAMRELILDWAATGKLCSVSSERWKETALDEVVELISGQHLLAHEQNGNRRGIPYLTGPADFGPMNPIPTRWTEQPKVTAQPGDILITVKGSGVGKTNVLAGEPMAIGRQLMAIRVTAADREFVHLIVRRAAHYFQNLKTGIAIPGIGRSDVLNLNFVLPPLAEQKRIVAKVDELMALCDRLEAQQNERAEKHAALAHASLARFAEAPTPANLQFLFHNAYTIPPADLRKSILTLAVHGKLLPQDSHDETAEVLLKRVDSEREQLVKAKKIRRQDVLGPVAEDAVPFEIPESWQWRYLADVCFLITDGAHHTPNYLEVGVPFLSVKDVSSGTIDYSRTRFISMEAHRELSKRCHPEQGDLLLTKVGTTGIAVTIEDNREFSIFVSLALIKVSHSNLDRQYLKHLINSPFVKQQSADNTQGIGNKNLVLRLINRFTVPIPPLAEQRRIVAKVNQLMALVDQLEAQLSASHTLGKQLTQAIVAQLTASPAHTPN